MADSCYNQFSMKLPAREKHTATTSGALVPTVNPGRGSERKSAPHLGHGGQTMKVRELIEHLQKANPEANINMASDPEGNQIRTLSNIDGKISAQIIRH